MRITPETHPHLCEAFERIRADRDNQAWDPAPSWEVPGPWARDVEIAEIALEEMSPRQREAFAIGDRDDPEMFPEGFSVVANDLLQAFFEEWDLTL